MLSSNWSTSATSLFRGRSSTTVRRSASRVSCSLWNCVYSSRNVASSATRLSPYQFLVKVLHDHAGPSQTAVERDAAGANQKSFRNDTRVHPGGHSPRAFFDHLLFFFFKVDHLGQAFVAKRLIRPIAHGVHGQFTCLREGLQDGLRNVPGARVGVNARPGAPILLRLVRKPHAP